MPRELQATLKVPAGFAVGVFAEGLGNPRMLAVAEDGTVYVTRPETNDVVALRDADGDGQADAEPRVVAVGLDTVHGIALRSAASISPRSTRSTRAGSRATAPSRSSTR